MANEKPAVPAAVFEAVKIQFPALHTARWTAEKNAREHRRVLEEKRHEYERAQRHQQKLVEDEAAALEAYLSTREFLANSDPYKAEGLFRQTEGHGNYELVNQEMHEWRKCKNLATEAAKGKPD